MQVVNFSFSLYNRKTMDEKKIEFNNHRRHVRVWRFARIVFRPILNLMFGYSGEQAPKNLKGPYIVLSNHNSNIDPIMIGTSFRQQMYFIASEQVYRWGFKSTLLKRYFEPISKIKGARDVLAITKALRKVKSGYNICLFPEGNRSFNGKTWPVLEATGKLIKVSGAGLVTYRLEGEYLAFPRWMTGKARKGKINGRFMHYYSPEELKAMSVQEITKHISDDIQENAFEYQEKNMIRYKGKNLAEGMECGECEKGIAICGSGEGISMTLNKHPHIRAALVWIPEIGRLARQHNDANVLVMPGRFIDFDMARAIMDEFLNTSFEGGRHERRVAKIPCSCQRK